MNYGDFPIEETIHVLFTTRAFATGIPGTLSAATVAVYEDITATPIETGVAVTESLNSIAGLNAVPIVAIAASGYEIGKNYHVVIEAGTVDSVSVVGEVVAYFSIGRSAAAVDLANGTDGLTALKTGIDGVPTTAEFEARTIVAANYFDPGADTVATVTTVTNQLSAATIANQVWDTDATGRQTQGTFGQAIGDPAADADTIYGSVVTGAAGANISVDIIALKAETVLILADTDDIGVAGAGLTDLGGMSDGMKAEVEVEVNDGLVALRLDELLAADSDIDGAAPPTVGSVFHELMTKTAGSFTYDQATDSLEAIRDRGDAEWITATGFSTHTAANVWAVDATGEQTQGTFGQSVGDPGATAKSIWQATVSDAVGVSVSADVIAVKAETALIVADTNELQTDDVPGLIAALNDITAASVWAVDATSQQTQGTFGQAIGDPGADADTIYGSVVTGAAGANISVDIIAIKDETALIVADTNETQGKLPTNKFMGSSDGADDDGNINAILTDTGTTIPATLEGLVLISKASVGATGNTTTAVHLATGTGSYSDDELNGFFLVLLDNGTGEWHVREITGFANTGDLATVATLPFTPATDDFYWLLSAQAGSSTAPTAAAVADAVWNEDATGHQTGGTFGQAIGDPGANTETMYDAVVTDAAGTNIAADIIVIEGQTDDIGVAGAGLTAINLPNQTMDITGSLSGSAGSVTGAVGSVAGNVDGNVTGSIGSLAAQAKTDVNAEADAALDTAISELGVAAPTATPTVRTALMLMYMALRNKLVVQTSGTDALEIYNNAGTKIASKALTDDGSDYVEAEMS